MAQYRYNDLDYEERENFLVQALTSQAHLNEIVRWLKDTERVHNQREDDYEILSLHSKADDLIANGIVLPPPSIEYIHSAPEFVEYLKKYTNNPHREATESEIEQMIHSIMHMTSHPYKYITALVEYGLLPSLEPGNSSYQIMEYLEKLNKATIDKMFNYFNSRGDFTESIMGTLLEFLKTRLHHWQTVKESSIAKHGAESVSNPLLTTNVAITNYKYAIDWLEGLDASKNIYTEMAMAGPNSHLSKLPYNLFPQIIEGVTGMKRSQYINRVPENIRGGRRKTKKTRKARKTRNRSKRKT